MHRKKRIQSITVSHLEFSGVGDAVLGSVSGSVVASISDKHGYNLPGFEETLIRFTSSNTA